MSPGETYICPECGTGEPDLHGYNCSRQPNRPSLLERLQAATEGSRELDLAIAKHFKECDPEAWFNHQRDCLEHYEHHDFGSTTAVEIIGSQLDTYTTSIDAALALVEGKYDFEKSNGRLVWTHNVNNKRVWVYEDRYYQLKGIGKTAELAICCALVKAKER